MDETSLNQMVWRNLYLPNKAQHRSRSRRSRYVGTSSPGLDASSDGADIGLAATRSSSNLRFELAFREVSNASPGSNGLDIGVL
jgi:hypothetical protein